ncbi:uncharacterized protein LOC26526387 [Drosophila erecta]|uniref:Uncharacterized protein n=1 Tax=Drosophila erecta TaxID=7220 RepID=A0A0Q5WAY3_DROER|nr:uncharacterized protein LOC26526387 [Drosophila erecta]KQS70573.1 uncharacterized protein Dere_GG26563 [Drosophila erecta]
MREYVSNMVRTHRYLCIFTVLQLTLMLSMLEVKIQIDQSPQLPRPLTRVYLVAQLGELAWSPLLSGFAMGAVFYGYGLIYLPSSGPLGGFFSRLRTAGLSVWQKCSPVMLVPWSMKVSQGLSLFPCHMWECLAQEVCFEADNCLLLVFLAVVLWNYLLILAITSLVLAVRLNLQMLAARHIDNGDHELRAYVRGINDLLGFEMIVLTA